MKKFYGALVGDMVGSVYEFHNIKTKDFPFWDKDCFATDDSIMTLAIAKALTDAVEDGTIAEAFYGVPEKHCGAVVSRLQAAGSNLYPILRRLDGIEWPEKATGDDA